LDENSVAGGTFADQPRIRPGGRKRGRLARGSRLATLVHTTPSFAAGCHRSITAASPDASPPTT
jgi:hypothetical protein